MGDRHLAGEASSAMAPDYGCSPQTVTRMVKLSGRWDGSLHHRSRHGAAQKQAMVDRYQAGESLLQVARDFGCTAGNVRFILLRRGVKTRPIGRYKVPQERLDWVQSQREAGISHQRIADQMGVSQAHVMALCRSMGLPADPRMSGPAHHAWKGGRSVNPAGYVQMWVAPDDPMASMAWTTGYVPEHRLVMARALGRTLTREETVHHVNGNIQDNRLANLQLRQGGHGKGVVMACLDCGSHNVGHVPLK